MDFEDRGRARQARDGGEGGGVVPAQQQDVAVGGGGVEVFLRDVGWVGAGVVDELHEGLGLFAAGFNVVDGGRGGAGAFGFEEGQAHWGEFRVPDFEGIHCGELGVFFFLLGKRKGLVRRE